MRRESGADVRGLERTFRERAAPAGSPRYYSLLFAPQDIRPALTALYAFDAEIRAAVHPRTEHTAAHIKLRWWRDEVGRMANGTALHPIGRALSLAAHACGVGLACLSDYLVAAEHDLAGLPIVDEEDLTGYCQRSGGLLQQLAGSFAQPAPNRQAEIRQFAGALGRGLRMTELLRSHQADLRAGRGRLPETRLRQRQLTAASFITGPAPPPAVDLLDELAVQAAALIAQAQAQTLTDRSRHRAALVLAELALDSLRRMRAARFASLATVEPAPFVQLWRAWRTARNA
jgi:phytoene synthase